MECGGKRRATPLSVKQPSASQSATASRSKAPSPLRSAGALQKRAHEYDRVGNRLWIVENDVPTYYTYDAANELLAETTYGEAAAYQYDGHGNTIARSVDGGDAVYYDYDARTRKGDRYILSERPEGRCAQNVPVPFSGQMSIVKT